MTDGETTMETFDSFGSKKTEASDRETWDSFSILKDRSSNNDLVCNGVLVNQTPSGDIKGRHRKNMSSQSTGFRDISSNISTHSLTSSLDGNRKLEYNTVLGRMIEGVE
eukprot:UN18208